MTPSHQKGPVSKFFTVMFPCKCTSICLSAYPTLHVDCLERNQSYNKFTILLVTYTVSVSGALYSRLVAALLPLCDGFVSQIDAHDSLLVVILFPLYSQISPSCHFVASFYRHLTNIVTEFITSVILSYHLVALM